MQNSFISHDQAALQRAGLASSISKKLDPPVGMNIFVIKGVIEDTKISTIFYGVLPFILTDLLRLALLVAFPMIALWLPSHM